MSLSHVLPGNGGPHCAPSPDGKYMICCNCRECHSMPPAPPPEPKKKKK